jgi:hypothetical protein
MVMRRFLGVAGLAGLLGVVPGAAPQTTFRVGNRTVAVYATVVDQAGRLVPDLSCDELEVEDDGRRQTLTSSPREPTDHDRRAPRSQRKHGREIRALPAGGGKVREGAAARRQGPDWQLLELHHQYALGFAPELLDGRTHKLTVRVRREGMTVRSRSTYLATAP